MTSLKLGKEMRPWANPGDSLSDLNRSLQKTSNVGSDMISCPLD